LGLARAESYKAKVWDEVIEVQNKTERQTSADGCSSELGEPLSLTEGLVSFTE
jgi:hypothetical protein